MCLKLASLALLCLGGLAAQSMVKNKRPHRQSSIEDHYQRDHIAAESRFVDFGQPAATQNVPVTSKYFQYIYVPAKHHYQHGHKRGNEHHFIERHEKGHLPSGEFKSKVRWGDKNGGYGEHYWDYNHAGQGDDGNGEESQQSDIYEEYAGEESQATPDLYRNAARDKRNPNDEVEFISDEAKSAIRNARTPKHGGNYRKAPEVRSKRQPVKIDPDNLVFDTISGRIIDRNTGSQYKPKEVE